jgi:hypothetical protein
LPGAYDLTFVWGSALPDGHPLEQLVLMGCPNYTACLAWYCTLSVCAAEPTGSAPRGPPSRSSSTSVVDATGPTNNAPRGATINDVFNLGGGRWGARHRRHLQPRWWMLSDPPPPIVTPGGATIDVFFNLGGGRCRTHQ